jgi:hypothetical protein
MANQAFDFSLVSEHAEADVDQSFDNGSHCTGWDIGVRSYNVILADAGGSRKAEFVNEQLVYWIHHSSIAPNHATSSLKPS